MIKKKIYLGAVRKSEKERPAFIEAVCAGCEELRVEVDSMIATHKEYTGNCGGETISLVLNSHQREIQSNRIDRVVPSIQKLRELKI